MFSFLDGIRNVNMLSVIVSMVLAVICGGLIGLEREHKRRPAGFRTHILICLGAAMATLTSQYLFLVQHQYTDIGRIGAQVVSGIGFIGAGTIIVTQRRRVKGLTTAAGLWASAIIGLACGAGFYEVAVFATMLILITELGFARLEHKIMDNAREVNLLVEYKDIDCLNAVLKYIQEVDLKILSFEILKETSSDICNHNHNTADLTLQVHRKIQMHELTHDLLRIPGVYTVEELERFLPLEMAEVDSSCSEDV